MCNEQGTNPLEFLIMNWADDVNYMFTDINQAKQAIKEIKEVAVELQLPFSPSKCKLVPIHPHNYKGQKERMGQIIDNTVTITEEAKILGIHWSQPRFRKGAVQMFQKDADEAINKIKELNKRISRIRAFGIKLNQTTQSIITNTYGESKSKECSEATRRESGTAPSKHRMTTSNSSTNMKPSDSKHYKE